MKTVVFLLWGQPINAAQQEPEVMGVFTSEDRAADGRDEVRRSGEYDDYGFWVEDWQLDTLWDER